MVKSRNVPTGIAVLSVIGFLSGIVGLEWNALWLQDPPKPYKVSCVSCHSDAKTLSAIASKSSDALYLVHNGDLSLADLKRLSAQPAPTPSK